MNLSSIDMKEVRKFGYIAFVFFCVMASITFWKGKSIIAIFFALLSLIGFLFILFPKTTSPLYSAWNNTAHFIGKVITVIFLTIAYYIVITPTGIAKRIISGKPLALKPDKTLSTYWVTRTEFAQNKERFIKRY